MNVPVGFVLQELVPPDVFGLLGDKAIRLIDPNVLAILAQIRADYGPLIVNNWHTGGQFKWRGFRPMNCPEGAPKSMHKEGKAIDCHSPRIAVEQMRREVIAKAKTRHPIYSLIGGIEDGVTWLHFDTRTRVNDQLLVFRS